MKVKRDKEKSSLLSALEENLSPGTTSKKLSYYFVIFSNLYWGLTRPWVRCVMSEFSATDVKVVESVETVKARMQFDNGVITSKCYNSMARMKKAAVLR